jgi:uncharacterized protein (TIGR00369 family)
MESSVEQPNESTPSILASHNRCFGCGSINPIGLHLDFQCRDESNVFCETEIPDAFSGYPGYVHGGIIATMLDEAMGKSARTRKVTIMTAKIELDYLRPVPTDKPLRVEGQLMRVEGRKFWTEGRILNSRGSILAKSKGLFVQVHERRESTSNSGN